MKSMGVTLKQNKLENRIYSNITKEMFQWGLDSIKSRYIWYLDLTIYDTIGRALSTDK